MWSPRSPGGGSRWRLWRGVGRAAALGSAVARRVLGVLKNPYCAGAYVHGRYTSARRVHPDGTAHARIIERPRRCSSATTTRATKAEATTRSTMSNWTATAPTPAPAHRGNRVVPGASSPAGRAESRCARTATAINARPTTARAAPIGPPPGPAAQSPWPPSMTRSPAGCSPR